MQCITHGATCGISRTTNQMHRHKGNAIPTGSYVGYFFPYITIGYRKNAEIYSENFQKVAL